MPSGVYKRTPENTKNVGKSKSMLGKIPWNKGKNFVEEIKIKKCIKCNIELERTFETKQNWNKKQYCSKRCMKLGNIMTKESKDKISKSKKGNIPWNKDKEGLQVAWNKGKKTKLFGLEKQEFEAGRKKPESCEICGAIGVICFDHDHATGKFRGWICWRCNVVLGHVKDNSELLIALSEYLK